MRNAYHQPNTNILPFYFSNTLCVGSDGGGTGSGDSGLGGSGSGADPWSGGRVPVE